MRPVEFGEALAAGTRLTLSLRFEDENETPRDCHPVLDGRNDRHRARIENRRPSYQVEDEEGRIHLLLHLPIEENEDRWAFGGGIRQALIQVPCPIIIWLSSGCGRVSWLFFKARATREPKSL